ncbi:MAG: protein kinase [Polyangiaceae bacterium]
MSADESTVPGPPPHDNLAAEKRDDLIGRVLDDRYQIMRLLAEGGMAKIYVGKHTTLGREVAIKVLKPSYAADPDVVQRFINEGRAAGMLGHRNIVECSDLGKTPDGKPYLVLELLHGHSVADEIHRRGPLTPQRTVRIALRIADALATAHAAGIVHRDLKTDNVFLARKKGSAEEVKVLDFGVSKFVTDSASTQKGALLGTPDFMSPEQIVDPSTVDLRTDIYAVGVILYEMLTGRRPFEGVKFPLVLHYIAEETPPALGTLRPQLSPDLVLLVERAMAKRAQDRYPSMLAFAEALLPFAPLPQAEAELFELSQRPMSSGRRWGVELAATVAAPVRVSAVPSLEPKVPAPPEGSASDSDPETLSPADAGGESEMESASPAGIEAGPVSAPPDPGSARVSAPPAGTESGPISAPPAGVESGPISAPPAGVESARVSAPTAGAESGPVSVPPGPGSARVSAPPGPGSARVSAPPAGAESGPVSVPPPTSQRGGHDSAPHEGSAGDPWADSGRTSLSPPRPQSVALPPPRRGLLSAVGSALAVFALIAGAYLAAKPHVPDPPPVDTAKTAAEAVTVIVQIRPPNATVTVDGQPAHVEDGRLSLTGAPGSTRVVRVSEGGREAREDVMIGLRGARPSLIEVPSAAPNAGPAPSEVTSSANTMSRAAPVAPATAHATSTVPALRDDR